MKFRKKPVVIEAHQWFKNGDHPEDGNGTFFSKQSNKMERQEGRLVRYFRHPEISGEFKCEQCQATMNNHGWIDTLEGGHNVCVGDWIIRGIKGEYYPCKPDIFEATYEAVE